MANHVIPNPGPHIATPATNRLLAHVDVLARRRPQLVDIVTAIRRGDDEALLGLVRAAQAGDRDAGTVAVGALLPKLCKVVLSKETVGKWESSIDDYLTLAYFSIAVVPDSFGPQLTGGPLHLTVRKPNWWFARLALAGFKIASHAVARSGDGSETQLHIFATV